jgi:hypothetical protein
MAARPRAPRTLSPRLLTVVREHLGMRIHGLSPRLSRPLYERGASVRNCDGRCCKHGSIASTDERDRILKERALVARHMTSPLRDRPDRWFEGPVEKNPDYTCGRSIATRVDGGTCVFQRSDKLCALQVAASADGRPAFALKPAMCFLWPLCVTDGRLDVGHAWYTRYKACCAPVRDGERTVSEVIGPDAGALEALDPDRSRRRGRPR